MRKIASSVNGLPALTLRALVILTLGGILAVTNGSAQVQPTFFAMGAASASDMPKVTYGVMSHPAVAWTQIEGSGRGKFNFTVIDNFVKGSPKDSNGVALIDVVFGWTPGWAVADQSTCFHNKSGVVACTAPPDNIQDWVNFIMAVIQHYNGVTAPHVKYYEIWNEMSNSDFWTGTPAQMVAMAQAAYPILKQDPYSIVFTPSVVWQNGVNYMTKYLQAGGYQYADALTFHGYPSQTGPGHPVPVPLPESPLSSNAPIMTMVSTFREIANSNGMSGKPIASTEGGWGTNGVSDPDMQAAWITHYEILQAPLASTNDMLFQTWYEWGKVPSGTIETNTGSPTPAGLAYSVVLGWLTGTSPSACTVTGNIYTCQLAPQKQVVWDTSQTCSKGVCTTSPYNPNPSYVVYEDITGVKQNIVNNTIQLGVKPILLDQTN
ncbi:MAG TPA: hypothetical protein VMX38_02785 [Verrucomicrobiae bacterium]|jgi:hypothetical protein|nr:hypothetical protein [Verrucomicrobiae bacterium]